MPGKTPFCATRISLLTLSFQGGGVGILPPVGSDEITVLLEPDVRLVFRVFLEKKEDFTDFIRREIDAGNPVIALGVIGPPEACVITGSAPSRPGRESFLSR